jgi:DNA replication protein DnaC
MLTNPTIEMLHELGLQGMAAAYRELDAMAETRNLEHGEWLALLVERETTRRHQRRFEARARAAKLDQNALVEDTDFRAIRGLDRALFMKLSSCDWIRKHHNLLVVGPAGIGKSWLVSALGHRACRENFSVIYYRVPRLFTRLAVARDEGRYARELKALAKIDVLILDDWGPEKLTDEQRRDLMEIVEDRYNKRSTIITSQIPVDLWYDMIGKPKMS